MLNSINKDKIYEEFFNLKDVFYIVKDVKGNILYPSDDNILRLYNELISSEVKSDTEFYNLNSKTWYRKYEKKLSDDIIIDFFEDITKIKEKLYELKMDALTKLLKDRNESDKLIFEYMRQALNEKEEFALVMADVDEFKTINDTYGHACGDLVLENVGLLLFNNTRQSGDKFNNRPSDIVVRIGGDEFLILLKNISLDDTKQKIDLLEETVKKLNINYTGDFVPVQMSFGYCHLNNGLDIHASVEFLKEHMTKVADEFLYVNKNRKKLNQAKEYEKIKKIRKQTGSN